MRFRNNSILVAAFTIILFLAGVFKPSALTGILPYQKAEDSSSKDTTWIFNGKDLSNFEVILENKNMNAVDSYNIKNRILYLKSKQIGYLRTKEKYSNFYFHAEWKWIENNGKGNSGILFYIQPPDTVWPNCIQVNLKANHAGDLIAMSGASFKEAAGKPNSTALIFYSSSEKAEGEWNSCNAVSIHDSLIVYINGELQNKATGIIDNNGAIGIQLEGKPIAFKNIYLIKK